MGASSDGSPYRLTFSADGLLAATMTVTVLPGYPSLLDVCTGCLEGLCQRPGIAAAAGNATAFVPPSQAGWPRTRRAGPDTSGLGF